MRSASLISLLLFGCAVVLPAQTDTAAVATNPTVAYVYVGENTAAGKIAAFAVQKNGSVAGVSGSPFAGPARDIVVSSGFVFGTDGTNIATYTRNAGGGLHLSSKINGVAHNDTPVGSAVGTLTLDRSGSSIYAGEINFQGTDNGGYAAFAVQRNGSLKFVHNAGISADYGGPLQFSENNQYAYSEGCYFIGWQINGFHREASGELIAFNPGTAIPPATGDEFLCPSALAVSAKGYLAVGYSNAVAGSKQNIALYRITSSGDLDLVSDSIITTSFTGIGQLRFDPTGTYLVAGGQNGIESFKLDSNGTLTRLGSVLDSSVSFFAVQWDSASHVYAVSTGALYIFTSHNGVLTRIGAPRPLANVESLAVLPTS